jgi:hypothetical protein
MCKHSPQFVDTLFSNSPRSNYRANRQARFAACNINDYHFLLLSHFGKIKATFHFSRTRTAGEPGFCPALEAAQKRGE